MKISLTNPTSGYNLAAINDNFDALEAEFQNKVLYRDNPSGEPNQMENDLDMNSFRILNLPAPLNVNEAARLRDVQNAIAGATQSNLINYTANAVSAIERTVSDRLTERVSVKDFGAIGDGVTNDSAAFALAVKSNRKIYVPAGTYRINSNSVFLSLTNFEIEGAGIDVTIIQCSPSTTFASIPWDFQGCSDFSVSKLTFDSNSNASVGIYPVIRMVSSNRFSIKNIKLLHSYIGLGIDSCSNFTVFENQIQKNAVATTLNYNINVSSTLSVSINGNISNNRIINSGCGIVGDHIALTHNYISNYSYGAAIATFAQGASGTTPSYFYGNYLIANNVCINGTQRDSDGFMVSGMEIAGPYSRIIGNTVSNNAGEGIRLFAYQSLCANNVVFNNGLGLDGTFTQGGIVVFDATTIPGYSASYSLITGNKCFDTGTNSQTYGYYEQQSTLVGLVVSDNDLDNNFTGPYLLNSSKAANTYKFNNWVTYTPVLSSTVGTITTVGAISGSYIIKGKDVEFQAMGVITTNGTGSGAITITIPIAANAGASVRCAVVGKGDIVSGKQLIGTIGASSTVVTLVNYDGTYPGANGERILVSGTYRI